MGLRAGPAAPLPAPRADLSSRIRELGVTHVLPSPAMKSDGVNSFAADLLFYELAGHQTLKRKTVGGGVLGELPLEPLTAPFQDAVAVFRCSAPGAR